MQDENIIRKCIGCNNTKSRNQLIKITVNKNKDIRVMPDSLFVGRSVYICKNNLCIENAFKKGKIFKFLKMKPDENLKEKINAVLEK